MAATVYYKDIIGQSSLTRGVANRRYDRALRVCEVGSLTNLSGDANTDLRDAINALLAQANVVYHYQLPDLPLREAVVRKWGPNIARVYLYYSRGTWSVPTVSAYTLTSFRTDTYTVEWWAKPYRVNPDFTTTPALGITLGGDSLPGFPNGSLEFVEVGVVNAGNAGTDAKLWHPKPWEWTRAALRIYVKTVLPFNPSYATLNLVNTINDNKVKMGGVTFPKYTVRFNGISVDPIEIANGQAMFSVLYDFIAVPYGFVGQSVTKSNSGFPWDVTHGVTHIPANFTNTFPIHG